MMSDLENSLFVDQVSQEAHAILDQYNEVKYLEWATEQWETTSSKISQVRPTSRELKRFIKDVIAKVIIEIHEKHELLTVVTMSTVVRQLVDVLINDYGIEGFVMYKIPIQIISAIIFSKILAELSNRVK